MAESLEIGDRLLVVFDGNCVLCNGWVRWLTQRDRGDRFRFAAFSTSAVAPLLERHGLAVGAGEVPGTVVAFRFPSGAGEQMLVRVGAVRAMLRELPRPWPAIAAALGWVPGFLSDPVYRLVARLRYRVWGRLESCPIPTAEERARFL
jgi:predicted DCC family thiol-disulfide oxidoreductase YuxK